VIEAQLEEQERYAAEQGSRDALVAIERRPRRGQPSSGQSDFR